MEGRTIGGDWALVRCGGCSNFLVGRLYFGNTQLLLLCIVMAYNISLPLPVVDILK